MAKVLIVYGTTEGHTRKIAHRVNEWVQEAGCQTDIVDSTALPDGLDVESADAYILAGSIHQVKHQAALTHFVHEHVETLNSKPSAFLSVSLSAVRKDEKHQLDAQKCINEFYAETGWSATESLRVAGALLYTQYDWLKRMLMREISRSEGGDVETSEDFEYTDWEEVKSFIEQFLKEHVLSA